MLKRVFYFQSLYKETSVGRSSLSQVLPKGDFSKLFWGKKPCKTIKVNLAKYEKIRRNSNGSRGKNASAWLDHGRRNRFQVDQERGRYR